MSASHHSRAFELVAGHPALDLVNTLDWRFRQSGPDELLNSYGDLLRFARQSKLLSPPEARELERSTGTNAGIAVLHKCRELREAVAAILYAEPDGRNPFGASIETLERCFKAARAHQELRWDESRLRWKWTGAEAAPEFPLWLLSRSASSLMLSRNMRNVRACGNPECRWLFLDTSKNHTRRWCDMKVCGNRMKARRFKAQQKA